MNKKLYPLTFHPILLEKVWGGDSLVKRYGKELPKDEDGNPTWEIDPLKVGESWELSAMSEEHDSVVASGYLEGNTLGDLLETYMGDFVGDNIFQYYNLQFPLLIKLLDVREKLSIQVHPDNEVAAERYMQYGKEECWYIMEAEPGARIHAGFKRDTSAAEFYNKCKDGTVTDLLNEYEPKAGDFFFIPAGTVHACGGGIVIAEVQEPSELTFRLYDWGRENNPKTARAMHLDEAIDIIDYRKFDETRCVRRSVKGTCLLADCPSFTVRNLELSKPATIDMEDCNSCLAYICTGGKATFKAEGADDDCTVSKGSMVLLPASLTEVTVTPADGGVTLLEAGIRHIEEEPDEYINPGVKEELEEEEKK